MPSILEEVEKFRKELADRRSIGLSAYDFVEQLTFLLFLKIAHERTDAERNQPAIIPAEYAWPALARQSGVDLEQQYRRTLEALAQQPGLVGLMYRKSQNAISSPAVLKRLVTDLVGSEGRDWTAMPASEKGEMFEHLLRKAAPNIGAKASQFYTSRALLEAIVEVVAPRPGERLADPACGTGGTLLAASEFLTERYDLDRDQKSRVQTNVMRGTESLDGAARLAMMNLLLHGRATFAAHEPMIVAGDPLLVPPAEHFKLVVTNPPFGSETGLESSRQDFWVASRNNQLNYLQHVVLMLEINGRAAIFVPDNVLFLGGEGEKVRRRLLSECKVHTLLRLPTGVSFATGIKSNVLFFDRLAPSGRPATRELWVYDFRTDKHFTPSRSPLRRGDLDDFVSSYCGGNLDAREETDRFRRWTLEDLDARTDFNLDVWAYLESGPELDLRPANEILGDLLARLNRAYHGLTDIGRAMHIETGPGQNGPPETP